MMTENHIDRISIQVGLSGYSFKVKTASGDLDSGWLAADSIFTAAQLHKRYEQVEISIFTPKCAIVPAQFHHPDESRRLLADVADIDEGDETDYVEVPQFASVLVFSNNTGESLSKVLSQMVLRTDGTPARPLPEQYYLLSSLQEIPEYNKVVASYVDGYLYLVVAQGKTLLLCNSFEAKDFTTAEYFIFMVMKKFQLNPEVTSIYFRTALNVEDEMSLYHYFRNVEKI